MGSPGSRSRRAGALAALVYGAVQTVEALLRPLPAETASLPSALLRSFLRLLVAYAISIAWTVPVAGWISRSALETGSCPWSRCSRASRRRRSSRCSWPSSCGCTST